MSRALEPTILGIGDMLWWDAKVGMWASEYPSTGSGTEIYFDPQDVHAWTATDGKRYFRIAWERPAAWETPGALKMSQVSIIKGWQIARDGYRQRKYEDWYRKTYPQHAIEQDELRAHLNAGGTVTSFHQGKT